MKSPTEQQQAMAKLNEVDLMELRGLIEDMNTLKTSNISIDNLHKIENVCRSLNAFREKYSYRVINLLKSGWVN
jgi:hypothetical protein